jgi:hypothetical protein
MPSIMPKTPEALNVDRPESCRATAMRLSEYATRGSKPRLGTFAEIPGILMKQAGEYGVAKEILGSEIAQRRAESLGISCAAFAILIIERKVMVPMRDGKRMAADIYRPEGYLEEVSDHLCAHALQLQLLGRAQRRAARYEARARRRQARLRVRRDE